MIDRYWTVLALSENLRPLLLQNEVELQMATPVHVYWGDTKVHRDGTATLTTHRLLWIGTGKKPVALCLALANVKAAEAQSGFMGFSSPKITVHLHTLAPTGAAAAATAAAAAAAGAAAAPAATPASAGGAAAPYTRLSFAGDSRDAFFAKLQSALKAAAWTVVPVAAVANASAASIAAAAGAPGGAAPKADEFKTSTAGIQGIIRKVKHTQAANDKTAEEAFKDLDALMKRAQEMVALAERFARSGEQRAGGAGGAASGDAKAESEAFGALLHGLGIPSPVTRQSAGTAYHVQLSRQLADFICPVLAKAGGGMLALTDVYCGFNRARGTELISPDDLLHACELFPQLGVPAALHVFPASGVKVLRLNAMTDEANSRRILAALTGSAAAAGVAPVAGVGSVSDLELSTLMGVSLVLAKQQLLVAEGLHLLVRDESADGVRFYPNRFNEWMSDAALATHNTVMTQRTTYAVAKRV